MWKALIYATLRHKSLGEAVSLLCLRLKLKAHLAAPIGSYS